MSVDLQDMLEHQRAKNSPLVNVKTWLIDKLLKSLNSRLGGFVQWAIGAAMGWIVNVALTAAVAWLLRHGIALPESLLTQIHELLNHLQEVLMVSGAFAVTTLIQYLQAKFTMQVQEHLGVERDGWIGPQTVKRAQAVKELVDGVQQP